MNVTTLIPAYKLKYLIPLMRGLGNQSVKPDRVIVSDDTPGRAFRKALQSERLRPVIEGLNIEVIDGPCAGFHPNVRNLLREWNAATDLLHLMFDDDIIYPEFYKRHLAAHAGGAVNCSISRRWTALETGQPVDTLLMPKEVSLSPLRQVPVGADLAFASTIPRCVNWFGEFSNAVFAKELRQAIEDASLDGISFAGLHDLGSILCASLQKPVCFMNEYLGAFRMNPAQMTQQTSSRIVKQGHLAWIAMALAGQRIGRLRPAAAGACFNAMGPKLLERYPLEADLARFRDLVPGLMAGEAAAGERFLEEWSSYTSELVPTARQ